MAMNLMLPFTALIDKCEFKQRSHIGTVASQCDEYGDIGWIILNILPIWIEVDGPLIPSNSKIIASNVFAGSHSLRQRVTLDHELMRAIDSVSHRPRARRRGGGALLRRGGGGGIGIGVSHLNSVTRVWWSNSWKWGEEFGIGIEKFLKIDGIWWRKIEGFEEKKMGTLKKTAQGCVFLGGFWKIYKISLRFFYYFFFLPSHRVKEVFRIL